MTNKDLETKVEGVGPTLTRALDPRQQRFIELYLDPKGEAFANSYKSAILAGFSEQTARNLSHLKPKWYSEIIGNQHGAEPEHLLLKLTDIMNDPLETTQNKLKAMNMIMKAKGMFPSGHANIIQIKRLNIQSVLD